MPENLAEIYRNYVACLNRQDWENLGRFVGEDVCRNGRRLGLSGYREMLENDFRRIPDLRFELALLVVDPPRVASRLAFDCAPRGQFLGLPVNGRRVRFCENVFYEFRSGKIAEVWSVIDKVAIESQLGARE
jgi:Predicted ester cyclase